MVHYGPHQAVSDATPIARGNTPLTIPILITTLPVSTRLRMPMCFLSLARTLAATGTHKLQVA